MTRSLRPLLAALLACLAFAVAPTVASASLLGNVQDPVTDWSSVLPSLSPGYDPDDPNVCKSGKQQCVDILEREMERRFNPLADSCDHNSMFALLYFRVTNQVGQDVWTPGRFEDPRFMTHYAAVFADLYFKGFDAWKANSLSTPTAWKIALDAARNKQVTSLGNLLLGMNAHINRDLPYTLYSIGLVGPNGENRKPDHDRINAVLYDAYGVAMAEAARRFDNSLSDASGAGEKESGIQAVVGWREQAWRNAERLAAASNDAERAMVEQSIEQTANLEAELIKASNSYGPLQSSASRDAYCAVHHDDA